MGVSRKKTTEGTKNFKTSRLSQCLTNIKLLISNRFDELQTTACGWLLTHPNSISAQTPNRPSLQWSMTSTALFRWSNQKQSFQSSFESNKHVAEGSTIKQPLDENRYNRPRWPSCIDLNITFTRFKIGFTGFGLPTHVQCAWSSGSVVRLYPSRILSKNYLKKSYVGGRALSSLHTSLATNNGNVPSPPRPVSRAALGERQPPPGPFLVVLPTRESSWPSSCPSSHHMTTNATLHSNIHLFIRS